MVSYILAAITAVIVLAADQFVKYFVSSNLVQGVSYDFIPGFIDIIYIKNDGAAWGMLGGYTWLLISITIVVMLAGIALLLKWGLKDKVLFWSAALILAGGIGNMIDRIFNDGFVVDFLNFSFIDFPVFNIADCSIVIGAGLIILSLFKSIIDEQKQKSRMSAVLENQDNNDGNI